MIIEILCGVTVRLTMNEEDLNYYEVRTQHCVGTKLSTGPLLLHLTIMAERRFFALSRSSSSTTAIETDNECIPVKKEHEAE